MFLFLKLLLGILILIKATSSLLTVQIEPKTKSVFLSGLINDYRQKQSDVFHVLHFVVGPKTNMIDQVARNFSEATPVILADTKSCSVLENREGSIIVIESNIFRMVIPMFYS